MADHAEDRKRYAGHYHWWKAERAGPMLLELTAALEKHPGGRLCIEPGMTDDGHVTPWLVVRDRGGSVVVAFNDSFGCPPRCE
jgi:hypothetical protein